MWKPPSPSDSGGGTNSSSSSSTSRQQPPPPPHRRGSPPFPSESLLQQATSTRTRYVGRRFGHVIRLKKEHVAAYKACHASMWPEVAKQIRDCNIQDYVIYHDDDNGLLFSSYRYVGYDYAGDMQRMRDNAKVREWWAMTDGFQESLVQGAVSSEAAGEDGVPSWWKPLQEVFYQA